MPAKPDWFDSREAGDAYVDIQTELEKCGDVISEHVVKEVKKKRPRNSHARIGRKRT
jgi:hypothetical protein